MVAHRCAAHRAFRGFFDAASHATVTAHVSQTSLEENAPESAPKVLIENGVDNGIQGRIHVTQPEGDRKGGWRNVTAWTSRLQNVQKEERQPRGNETAHDKTENECGTFLFFTCYSTFFLFGITWFLDFRYCRFKFGHFHVFRQFRITSGTSALMQTATLFAKYRLAQPELGRFHNGTSTDHTRIRTGRIKFTDHITVDSYRQCSTSTGRWWDFKVTAFRWRRSAFAIGRKRCLRSGGWCDCAHL